MPEEPEDAKPVVEIDESEVQKLEINDDVTSEAPLPTAADDTTGSGSVGSDLEDGEDPDTVSTRARLLRLGRRLLDPREVADDTKKVLGSVLEGSDWAKTEVVKLAAREVRNYLDELRVGEDLKELMTNHTLKVTAEFSLIPHELADAVADDDAPDGET